MGTRVLCLLTIVFSMAAQTFAASPTQPVIVARVNRRNVSQSIPTTTLFTPSHTGLYRASTYMTVTSPGAPNGTWELDMQWNDDAGAEIGCLAISVSNATPPFIGPYSCGQDQLASPFVFEAVAGQPVTFSLTAPYQNPVGTMSLAIIIEKLE